MAKAKTDLLSVPTVVDVVDGCTIERACLAVDMMRLYVQICLDTQDIRESTLWDLFIWPAMQKLTKLLNKPTTLTGHLSSEAVQDAAHSIEPHLTDNHHIYRTEMPLMPDFNAILAGR
jgi:hypothetical protein